MIKHNGKMVPAKKVDGRWVPDDGAVLSFNGEGLEVIRKEAAATEPAPEKKGIISRLMGK